MIAEYSEADSSAAPEPQWRESYVHLGGRLLATLAPGVTGTVVRYHHPDRLGTRLITNGTDAAVTEYETFSFGVEEGPVIATGHQQRFTSYDRSARTGLDYAVNRTYDPRQGRFTQVDPLGIVAANLENPQSLNMYAYVRNDPVNATDPLGLMQNEQILYCEPGAPEGGSPTTCYWVEVIVVTPQDSPESLTGGRGLLPGDNPRRGSRDEEGGRGGGGGRGAGGGGSCTVSLQEAIYRGLGGRGPYAPGPRPTTQLDVLAAGIFVAPAAVVGAVEVGIGYTAIETSATTIALSVRALQAATRYTATRLLLGLVPGINRMMGGDTRYGGSPGTLAENLRGYGYRDWEINVFQGVQIARTIVQSNPQLIAPICGGR